MKGPADRDSWRTIAVGGYLIVLGFLLGSLLVALWPAVEMLGVATAPQELSIRWLGSGFSMTPEGALLLVVTVFGALGAYIHTVTSFADYVGNDRFESSWTWWYVLRPFVGTALALVFYVAIRGGFFAQEAQTGDVNPFGIAALAGLAGMFSKQATDKLREVFDTLFRTAEGRGDDQRRDSLAHPVPMLDHADLEPEADGQAPRIRITGAGFVRSSTVLVDNLAVKPISASPTELSVELGGELGRAPRTVEVRVRNPEPGGGTSAPTTVDLT